MLTHARFPSKAVFFQINISSPLLCLWPSCHSLLGLTTSLFIGEHIKSSAMSNDVHGLLRGLLHSMSEEIQAIKLQIQRKRSHDERSKHQRSVGSLNRPRPYRNADTSAQCCYQQNIKKNTAFDVMFREVCAWKCDAPRCLRIHLWLARRDDSSRVLIGAAALWAH